MLLSGFSAPKKSLLTTSMRYSFSTIAVFAGSPSWDAHGARIMREIKKNSPRPINFIGIGGPEMKAAGLEKSYADINVFPNKPMVPYKNHLRMHIIQKFHPVMAHLHYKNNKVVKAIEQNGFFNEISSNNKPNLFITFGNEFFMRDFYKSVHKQYVTKDIIKPPLFHYDQKIFNQRIEFSAYVDYWLHTNPREPVNWRYYKFPSTYVGNWCVARALAYLYKTNPKTESLVSENTLYVSKEYNHEVVENLLAAERVRFRKKFNIDEGATVFYTLPGNTPSEVNWSIPLIHGTVSHFLQQHSQFSANNFALVITSDSVVEKDIVDNVNKLKWPCQIVVTKTAEEKYSALAGSDMAAVCDGEAVGECAAYLVPTVILNQAGFFQSYVTLLYNSFANDMNLALNGEAFPETLGQCFKEKIAEYWTKWFNDPKSRHKATYRFEKFVPQLVPEVKSQINDNAGAEGKQLVTENHYSFDKYYFSEYLAAQKILQAAQLYQEKAHSNWSKAEKVRKEILKTIETA